MKADTRNLGDLTKIRTGKLDANASSEDGQYPFFTCARQPLRIDSYTYDCECVLVAGNGDLNVKYYDGKFDAYQRTYIVESRPQVKEDVHLRYIYHFLETYLKKLREQSIGGIIKYIKLGNLTEAKIPLPPLAEQKRIASILDTADVLRTKRRETLDQLDTLLQSTFLDMFGDPVTNPKGWEVKELADVTKKITDGAHFRPKYTKTGIPFVSVKDITTGELSLENTKFVSDTDHDKMCRRCNPEYGDVLYTKVGATYGRPALVNTHRQFSLYVSVALIKPNHDFVLPEFLSSTMGTVAVKRQADRSIKGAGVPDLHLNMIKKFLIPVPPFKMQERFLSVVHAINSQKFRLRSHLAELDTLFASLQSRAFNGEL